MRWCKLLVLSPIIVIALCHPERRRSCRSWHHSRAGGPSVKLAHAVRADGIDPFIILLAGQADADFTGFDTASYPVGKIGQMVEALKEAGVTGL